MRYALALLLVLAVAGPAHAQEWQVARESFAFAGNRLTILVDAETPGTLRIIRGGPGSVRVASRAPEGFTAAGLGERDELVLSSAGSGPVDYMVAVPERVWVQVRLPGHTFGESVASRSRSRTFQWGDSSWGHGPPTAHEPVPSWLPPVDGDASLQTTFTRDLAPPVVSLPDLSNIRSVSVRVEPGPFRVMATRPLSIARGVTDLLEIRPGGPPLDLVITVPEGTRQFRLTAAGLSALVLEGDSLTALCSPVTDQRLSDGRRWLTFNPVDGALRCADPPTRRHDDVARRHEG